MSIKKENKSEYQLRLGVLRDLLRGGDNHL